MPSPLTDAAWRAGLRVAFALQRVYWFAIRPTIRSVDVAVWSGGRVLLVRQSYRRGLGLPGGGLRCGERPECAAARELGEEVGINVAPAQLSNDSNGSLCCPAMLSGALGSAICS